MTDAQVQTFAGNGTDNNFDAFLYTNSGGVPGAVIAELASAATAPAYGGGPNMITLGTPISLTSGTEYWLVLAPADAHSSLAWEDGGLSNVPFAFSENGGAFSPSTDNAQFEIDGTPLTATPEPVASWFLAAAFCAGTITFRKLRVQ
jgi:hypothetical protein